MAIQLELTELKRLSSRCGDINSSISKSLDNIYSELESVCENVQSSSLIPATRKLEQSITSISTKVANNLPAINEFLASQVNKYEDTNIVAKEAVESLSLIHI